LDIAGASVRTDGTRHHIVVILAGKPTKPHGGELGLGSSSAVFEMKGRLAAFCIDSGDI
jgi:hypothetical protein